MTAVSSPQISSYSCAIQSLEMDPGSDTDKVPAKAPPSKQHDITGITSAFGSIEQLVKAGKDGLTSFG